MNSQSSVINPAGDFEESIERLAKHLGRDKHRRTVFNLIYGRGSKARSKRQIAETLGIGGTAQVVQNSLDDLAKHHLIVRMKNEGFVKDGSRWVYAKHEFVRANREKIVRYADDPSAAKKVATKRRPATGTAVSFVTRVDSGKSISRARRRNRPGIKVKIALLVTNPDRRASLQTGIEARDIDAAIKLGGRGTEVDLQVFLAPTFDTLIDALNSYLPDILHFSGHGGGGALLFDNERPGDDGGTVLDFDMVARLLATTSRAPKLLVLVACDTTDGAERFLDVVPSVIAMKDSIDDEAACEFSARFYRSLSSGASIRNALSQAKAVLGFRGYADADLPQLIEKNRSAGDRVFL